MKARRKGKRRKAKLTAEEKQKRKLQRLHKRSARSIFHNLGFQRAEEVSEKTVEFEGQTGEFDDVFVHENLVIFVEYTISQTSGVTEHIKKKNIFFTKINSNPGKFLALIRAEFRKFDRRLAARFHPDKYITKILYCSYQPVDTTIKGNVPHVIYMDLPYLKYFEKISSAIKSSDIFEFLEFLGIDPADVATEGVFGKTSASETYEGSILPESASGFPRGYKVVSFYADAASLLKRAFVLRRDGWRGSFEAYQRMIQPGKIEEIRKKLRAEKQVFVNNLIATLPSDVHPVDRHGATVDIAKLTATAPVRISLPLRANSIGLIDGQHRLFSYYESIPDDREIAKLRHQQNLLVTGIIYPDGIKAGTKEHFEAGLFLSINSNQTNAPTALRQEIEVILNPYSPTAIGKQVIQRLSQQGPLVGHIESYFFDKGKLKTASIVSYGLGPLTKLGGDDSLFRIFRHPKKAQIKTGASSEALEAYVTFAAKKINIFMSAVKENVDKERWTADPSVKNRALTVTYVNSFLIVLRMIVKEGMQTDFDYLKTKLVGIDSFKFSEFHSSQYARMAEKIFDTHFK